jgi:hypothetical protein
VKITRIDATFAVILLVAILITVLALLAADGPAVEVRDFTITEVPSASPAPPANPI